MKKEEHVKIYLVGGAVRDFLLGRKVTERDYVVVGATPEELLAKGFRPVGNDFPVFLHPKTHEEYALARTERKTGQGYTGFECFSDPSVTLEQDLLRRDLTINAMAQEIDSSDQIIDPYGGQEDLKNKQLRHVSPAFSEDPVRILRVARFAARFSDFSVHPDTNQLMQKMVEDGEVNALVPERVWKEFSRALTEADPNRFFRVLKDCGALAILFPEFEAHLKSFDYLERSPLAKITPQFQKYLIDNLGENHFALLNFCALCLALNSTEITSLCQRLRPPAQFSDLALLACNNIQNFQNLDINEPEMVIQFLEKIDAYRRTPRFLDFCYVVQIFAYDSAEYQILLEGLYESYDLSKEIDSEPFIKQGLQGEAIGSAIHQARVQILRDKKNG